MNVSNKNSKITSAASKYEYISYELIWKKDYLDTSQELDQEKKGKPEDHFSN